MKGPLSKLEAAHTLGMKEREIIAVEDAGDGWVVTTHDHQRTHLLDDGTVAGAYTPPEPAAAAVDTPAVPAGSPPQPEGTEKQILEWAGADRERAERALRAEREKETPRKGLVSKLEQLIEAG